MSRRVRIAAALSLASLLTVGGGALLIQRARAVPSPVRERPREVPGVVLDVATAACGKRSRPRTCYRPIVGYTHEKQPRQVASRALYHPFPNRKGDAVPVVVESDGTAWIASEWDTRQAERERDAASARRFPFVMGVLLLGCGAFGLVLAAAVAFFADRSPSRSSGGDHA